MSRRASSLIVRPVVAGSGEAIEADTAATWAPQEGPQKQAYYSDADELFYGGSAGGGKTDLLLGLAGTAHWRSIIFRRVFPSMRSIIERSREVYNATNLSHARDSYNESLHIWRLGSGRMVEFGSIQFLKDVQNYRGRPHDFYGWDEATEFTEQQFRFVNAWNRSTRPGQRCRVVATGNPPTSAEGEWVIRYWAPWLDSQHANPAKPGELRWFATIKGEDVEVEGRAPFEHEGEWITPRSRTFIPASLADNPILEATGYRAVLQGLPEPLRSQLLYGDFTVGLDDDPWQVVPTEWVRLAQRRWEESERPRIPLTSLGVDPARGGKDKTVIARRYGAWLAPLEKYPGSSTPDGPAVAALVTTALGNDRAPVNIDPIGIGASPLDILCGNGVEVNAINFAESTDLTDKSGRYRLRNVRAAAYWRLREALDPSSGENIALPPDRELLADLCAARWSLQISGITVEPKQDIAERLGRSPDCGDAVALAFYDGAGDPDPLGGILVHRVASGWNP